MFQKVGKLNKRWKPVISAAIGLWLVAGCSTAGTPTVTPTAVPTATRTALPPTLTPVPPPATPDAPAGPTYLGLSPANAAQVTRLNSFSLGAIVPVFFQWLPDNQTLLVTERTTVGVSYHRFQVASGAALPAIESNDAASNATLGPGGKIVATSGGGTEVQVWDAATGQRLYTLVHAVQSPDPSAMTVAISPDGRTIATANSNGGDVRLWDDATGAFLRALEPDGQTNAVQGIAFSADGQWLVTREGSSGSVSAARVWAVESGELLQTLTAGVPVLAVLLSPDGRLLTMTTENTVLLWSVATGQLLQTIPDQPYGFPILSPDGGALAVMSMTNNAAPNECTPPLRVDVGANQPLQFLANCFGDFSADGQLIATTSPDGTVNIWEVKTGALQHTLDTLSAFTTSNGRVIATANGAAISLWDARTGQLLQALAGDGAVVYMLFSPNQQFIASLSADNTVQVWGIRP